ncbi:hypothetical protein [Actinophytocola sediminis]
MILSAHIVNVGAPKAVAGLRAKPDPRAIQGLRYAESWLVSPLRTGLLPSTQVQGIALIAAWDDDDSLDRFLHHPLAKLYEPGWRARFEPVRTVGAWPGMPDLPRTEKPTDDEPVAVLTMAKMRLTKLGAFAAAAGPAEREAQRHPGFIEGASLMHPPNLISTFTLWRTAREMRQYTVGTYPGGHRDAMKKNDDKVFHHETVFVRLRPYEVDGLWNGRNPLASSMRPKENKVGAPVRDKPRAGAV